MSMEITINMTTYCKVDGYWISEEALQYIAEGGEDTYAEYTDLDILIKAALAAEKGWLVKIEL